MPEAIFIITKTTFLQNMGTCLILGQYVLIFQEELDLSKKSNNDKNFERNVPFTQPLIRIQSPINSRTEPMIAVDDKPTTCTILVQYALFQTVTYGFW